MRESKSGSATCANLARGSKSSSMSVVRAEYKLDWLRYIAFTAALIIAGCGGDSVGGFSQLPNKGFGTGPAPSQLPLKVAVEDAPYSDVLVTCANAPTTGYSCFLDTLPLIGQENASPTIDDIIERTVVSHDWMTARFRDVLQRMPSEMLMLFKGVTSVVIAGDIRPSYYTPGNGAIHIDPAILWTTNAEKATISRQDDYRADFGNELDFIGLWRYMDGSTYAWDYYSLDGDETRTVDDLIRPAAALLFHELAHANDFFPPASISSLDSSLSVAEAADALNDSAVSAQLDAAQPLNSQLWEGLAQVLYQGASSTAEQRALGAAQVGLDLESDGANDDYAYSSKYEDTAMLFEEVMLKHHFGLDRVMAYTDVPAASAQGLCESYIVRWGTRGRAGDSVVSSRAELVLQLLLDRTDVSGHMADLATPTPMNNGDDWCVEPPAPVTASNTAASPDTSKQPFRPDDRSRPW